MKLFWKIGVLIREDSSTMRTMLATCAENFSPTGMKKQLLSNSYSRKDRTSPNERSVNWTPVPNPNRSSFLSFLETPDTAAFSARKDQVS